VASGSTGDLAVATLVIGLENQVVAMFVSTMHGRHARHAHAWNSAGTSAATRLGPFAPTRSELDAARWIAGRGPSGIDGTGRR